MLSEDAGSTLGQLVFGIDAMIGKNLHRFIMREKYCLMADKFNKEVQANRKKI